MFKNWIKTKKSEYKNKMVTIFDDEDKINWEIIVEADFKEELLKKLEKYYDENKESLEKNLILHDFGNLIEISKYSIFKI